MNKRNSKTKITSKTFPNVQKGTLRVSKPIANTIPSNINTGSKKEAEKAAKVLKDNNVLIITTNQANIKKKIILQKSIAIFIVLLGSYFLYF